VLKLAKPKAIHEPTKIPVPKLEISTNDLAEILGKSPQWLRQLTREGVLSQSGRGKFVLSDAIRDYLKHIEGTSEEGKINYRDEKAEHERIKKEIAMLELEEMRKNLHTTADVQDAWGMLLVDFRGRLMGLSPRISNELSYMTDPKEIRVLLEQKIGDALQELARYDPLASDTD
jgi:hypothetical protein